MRASEERGQKQFGTNRHLPLTAIIGAPRYGSRVQAFGCERNQKRSTAFVTLSTVRSVGLLGIPSFHDA